RGGQVSRRPAFGGVVDHRTGIGRRENDGSSGGHFLRAGQERGCLRAMAVGLSAISVVHYLNATLLWGRGRATVQRRCRGHGGLSGFRDRWVAQLNSFSKCLT